jgi:hypothetical protein
MVWTLVRVFVAFSLLVCAVQAALAGKRVALVIGNSAYAKAPALTTPKNDAEDMAAALKAVGFTVILGMDLDKTGMERKIREFAGDLSGAEAGVFHYSGHGIQVSGVNYLVPVDAELTTAATVDFEAVRLDLIQHTMEAQTKTNILFLDACRNNPLTRNLARAFGTRALDIGQGLASMESGAGTLISFSTQPGNVALDGTGRNSPYSGPLAEAIGRSGEDVLSMLIDVRNAVMAATGDKQVPWDNHALRAKFYFNPTASQQFPGNSALGRPLGNPQASEDVSKLKMQLTRLEKEVQAQQDKPSEEAALRERIARLEADLAQKKQPETAPTPLENAGKSHTYWMHNGSSMLMIKEGTVRRFLYENPREGMRDEGVTHGTLLFEGAARENAYFGTAYVFSGRCRTSFPYQVSGNATLNGSQVRLFGKAPSRISSDCQVLGYRDDTLVFDRAN